MSAYMIHVYGKKKLLTHPIPNNYVIGLTDINYTYKKSPSNKLFQPHFNLICNEIEPSPITGSSLRNLFINTSPIAESYVQFRNVEHHKLINNNLSVLTFQWPENIEIIYFSLELKKYDS